MKRIYSILCGGLLTLVLLVGLISLFGDSTGKPKLTVSGLLDGSYWEAYTEYYASVFPGRERLLESYEKLEGFYTFGGEAPEQTEPVQE